MKELQLLEEWADKIVTNEESRLGQPIKGIGDRPLPRGQDIMYQAQRKYPDRSPEQALSLYINDEMEQNKNMDFEQNKLINAQKRENEKLRRSLDELGNELHDHERTAQDTEREVQRLKDLSSKLKPAGEIQQQLIKASQEQVQGMLNDLEQIKNKPGIDEKQYQELKAQVDKAKTGTSAKQLKELELVLSKTASETEIEKEKLQAEIDRITAQDRARDERFTAYTQGTKKAFSDYEKKWVEKFSEIEDQANEKLEQITQTSNEAEETLNRIAQMVRKLNPNLTKTGVTFLSTLDDRDEAQQQFATPTATTLPPPAYDEPEDEISEPDDTTDEINPQVTALLNKFNRTPRNVKRNGQMNEQIEMIEPEDEFETIIIPSLVRRYARMYPDDLKRWTDEQLKTVLRRTVDAKLLIWAPDIDETRVRNYMVSVHNYLRKLRPMQMELPGIPDETEMQQPKKSTFESTIRDFEKSVNKLTNGF